MSGLISVVVPVYNMGNSLDRCVASILSQENADDFFVFSATR